MNESDCKMGTITNYMVQIEYIEEEKVKTLDAYFANDIPLLHSFVEITHINYMFANKENDDKKNFGAC